MKMKAAAIALALCLVMGFSAWAQSGSVDKPKAKALPILLNYIPGFGVGSFVQGDKAGGTILLVGEISGLGLMTGGYVLMAGSLLTWSMQMDDASYPNESGFLPTVAGAGVFIGGAVVLVATEIFGLVRPITFANSYNKAHGFTQARLTPTLSVTNADGEVVVAPGAMLKLSF